MSLGCYLPLRDADGDLRASVLVDREDAVLAGFTWCLSGAGYAVRPGGSPSLHRLLLGLEPSDVAQVDHINRDKLDCRRANLRLATNAENHQNLGVSDASRSGYRGVSWSAAANKWRARVGDKYLGVFADAADADAAVRAYRLVHMPFSSEAR